VHRTDLSRLVVSDTHWDEVRTEREAQGHDRESYEYACTLAKAAATRTASRCAGHTAPRGAEKRRPASYLLKLDGPLSNPSAVKRMLGLSTAPRLIRGVADDGKLAHFFEVDGDAKARIETALRASLEDGAFQPLFVRDRRARKALSATSLHPLLGSCATLPQFRRTASTVYPSQDGYPVWYFFYGTLADRDFLAERVGLSAVILPDFRPASVRGGKLTTWGGKYKGMVDGALQDVVQGRAYLVGSSEEEQSLRFFETDRYEVVRCEVRMGEETVSGLTFRFTGPSDDDHCSKRAEETPT